MKHKAVECFQINGLEKASVNFENLLNKKAFKEPYLLNNSSKLEISYVENKGDYVIGMFVVTQNKGIPPAHKPGEEENYEAVLLEAGAGLAYPNVFLYQKKTQVLYLETNKFGATKARIEELFNTRLVEQEIPAMISLEFVLTEDAYNRISNLRFVSEVELQVATPTLLLEDKRLAGSVQDYAKFAKEINATKSMSIILKGEFGYGGLRKNILMQICDTFERLEQKVAKRNIRNKLIVKGTEDDPDGAKEAIIDFYLDKIKGYFKLEELEVASHIQVRDRKAGIREVYEILKPSIERIIK